MLTRYRVYIVQNAISTMLTGYNIDVNDVETILCIHRSHRDVDDVNKIVHRCERCWNDIVHIAILTVSTILTGYNIDVNDVDTISCIHRSHRDVDDVNNILHRCERFWHDIVYTSFTSRYRLCRQCYQDITSMWTMLTRYRVYIVRIAMSTISKLHRELDMINFLCAFRKGHGCQTVLLRILEDWREALEKNLYTAAILMDLSNALFTT